MPDIDLDKLSPELRSALEKELAPKPERSDGISVRFDYDANDLDSVKLGVKRGHVTRDEALAWGYSEDDFPEAAGDGGGDGGKGDGGGAPPKRGGYFGS